MEMLVMGAGIGFAIGAVLGLLGGGGSILTVPALVYVVGQSTPVAITSSLVIVGANSMIGAFFHRAHGTLNWRVALLFGGTGMIFSYIASDLRDLFPPVALMIAFAVLMFVVGLLMILRKAPERTEAPRSLAVILASGAGVGLLTGFLGVGGGFLIVPALVMLIGLPMRQAVGTSLVIIAMNSLAALASHLGEELVDLNLIVILITAGIIGTLVGSRLTRVINPETLRRLFAFFVIGLSIILLVDNVGQLL